MSRQVDVRLVSVLFCAVATVLVAVGVAGGVVAAMRATTPTPTCFASPRVLSLGDTSLSTYDNASSIGLSCHGQMLVVGQSVDGSGSGQVLVYRRQTNATAPPASAPSYALNRTLVRPIELDGDGYARAVAVSDDGSLVAVTSRHPGRLFVYNSTLALTQALVAPATSVDGYGVAISVSSNGSTVVVGDSGSVSSSGFVDVFVRLGDGITYARVQRLTGTTFLPAGVTAFGVALALAADASRLFVGAPRAYGNDGAVVEFIYDFNASSPGVAYTFVRTWPVNLVGLSVASHARLGSAVAFDVASGTVAFGADNYSLPSSGGGGGGGGGPSSSLQQTSLGAVIVVNASGALVTQTLVGSRQRARFGASVSLRANTLVVGSWSSNEVAGAADVCVRPSTSATFVCNTTELGASNARGRAVAVASDAATAATTLSDESVRAAVVACLSSDDPAPSCSLRVPTLTPNITSNTSERRSPRRVRSLYTSNVAT